MNMDISMIVEQSKEKSKGNVFDYLIYVYDGIKKEQGQEAVLLQQFILKHVRGNHFDKEAPIVSVTEEQLIILLNKYQSLVDGYVNYLVLENLAEHVFYERLWAFIHKEEVFPDELASKIAFIVVCKHQKLPYFYISNNINMEEGEYGECMKATELQQKKMTFVLNYGYVKKSEQAAAMWSILNEISDEKQKIVAFSWLLNKMTKVGNK
jgi:hypothetical protein